MHRIFLEAAGCITTGYLIRSVHQAGYSAIAADMDAQVAASVLADEFFTLPSAGSDKFWESVYHHLTDKKVDVVFPSLHETLLDWSERSGELRGMGIHTVISEPETIRVCTDKWLTYLHFTNNGIPVPDTSLSQNYRLVKPRFGRGGKGIVMSDDTLSMEGMISQQFVSGQEYTVDVFCDRVGVPVYIIPRKRLQVKDGKSTAGVVVNHSKIIEWVKKICAGLPFTGPVNLQCIETPEGEIKFIEINPRVAGGMALGFAASENWIALAVDHFIHYRPIEPKPVAWGLKMMRYYEEVFTAD
ncbi:ATP-grasp domain-containing protein [Paenibacillus sp. MBLB4367]|uniref:ATP-grasp domain-containing protein n=1 Tax=Paenibacillus sp. MBLB4367 TaxID=3384767 RepID=UPI003908218F